MAALSRVLGSSPLLGRQGQIRRTEQQPSIDHYMQSIDIQGNMHNQRGKELMFCLAMFDRRRT